MSTTDQLVSLLKEGQDFLYRMERINAGDRSVRLHLNEIIQWTVELEDWASKSNITLPNRGNNLDFKIYWEDSAQAFVLRMVNRLKAIESNLEPQQSQTLNGEYQMKPQQISVLFLAADPTDASRLRLGEEFREIQEQLMMATQRDLFKLENPQLSVRPSDISRALLNLNPQIVHFSGHGTTTGALCFENQRGETHLVQPEALASLFEQFASQVQCVILNACHSIDQANAIAQYIDYVIGMNQAIGDKAAIAFAVGFYQAIGAGRPIVDAYKLGCAQIRLRNIPEHLTPVIIRKNQDGFQETHLLPNSQSNSEQVSAKNEIGNDFEGKKFEHPKLALKIIDNMGQHVDEISFIQTTNRQDFSFGLALLNLTEGSEPVEKIDIRVECSWEGEDIAAAPKFNTDRYGRTTSGWQTSRQLIQQGITPYPAVFAFHGSSEIRCAFGHPIEWHRFSVTVAEKMIGKFILSYTISSASPRGEYQGSLAIVMSQAS